MTTEGKYRNFVSNIETDCLKVWNLDHSTDSLEWLNKFGKVYLCFNLGYDAISNYSLGLIQRVNHKNAHFVVTNFAVEMEKVQQIIEALPGSSIKTLTLLDPKDNEQVFKCDKLLQENWNSYSHSLKVIYDLVFL